MNDESAKISKSSQEEEMQKKIDDCLIFSGSSHPALAQEIAQKLGGTLSKTTLTSFPDGEIEFHVHESVRNRDTFVIQSVGLQPNQYLMELLIMIDALKRASAKSIVAVIPYFGYCRQDRKDKPRVPITAKLIANLLEKAGATRVLTMDLHTGQVQGFFDIPVDNLFARPALVNALERFKLVNPVVVTPDFGSIKLARAYATQMGVDFAIVDKHRSSATQVSVINLIGDVKGKDVLLADDMCSTGGTLVSAAKACHEKGATRVFAAVTHGLFVGNAVKLIEESPIEALLMSNTIPATERLDGFTKLATVSVASLFAHAIHCILSAESISSLFDLRE